VPTLPERAPKVAKNVQPAMFATQSGTIVCISKVATKKMAPTKDPGYPMLRAVEPVLEGFPLQVFSVRLSSRFHMRPPLGSCHGLI
jgi:hypothetical protein